MTFNDFAKHQKTFSKNNVLELPIKSNKIPYKTCRSLIILGPFSEKGPQKYQKRIRFSTKSSIRFTTLQTSRPLVKQCFGACKKGCSKYLMKPDVYWSFWGPFRQKALKSIKKALGFPLKVDDVSRLRKTSKTFSKTTFWSLQKSCSKYLIKPVVYWSFWGPFRQKALKSIKKH